MIDEADLAAEIRCAAVKKIMEDMLRTGIITENEKDAAYDIMLERYRPVLGMLLAGKSLI